MKKVSSVVWQFFDRVEKNNRCVAVLCKLCDNEYKYFGNTTNLRSHLMKKHPIQWELRQDDWGAPKTIEESTILKFDDDESTNQSTASPKRRKYTRVQQDQNVDVLENSETEIDPDNREENEATLNLVRQMHNSDEEWLEEAYQAPSDTPKRTKLQHRKIKREYVSPPRQRQSAYIVQRPKQPRSDHIIIDNSHQKDEYSVFGEYIANKLRKFKAPRTRSNIQQLITTILWQAEYGMYDDADAVKRMLLAPLEGALQDQCGNETELQPENTNGVEPK